MNYALSILFRLIPLLMGIFCFSYGAYIYFAANGEGSLTAGPVIFFLGTICLALYATAATIIRQLIGTYNRTVRYALPIGAYALSLITLVVGLLMVVRQPVEGYFVAGHVVCGLGLIAMCVSTAATASTRFTLIPENSSKTLAGDRPQPNPRGFTPSQEHLLEGVVAGIALVAWLWAVILLSHVSATGRLVAGCVMAGIACVCTSLIALVASIARQVRGIYRRGEKEAWMSLVLVMGAIAFLFGVIFIIIEWGERVDFVGFVLIGLGLICWSISSKVILLAKIWRDDFPLASRMPIIPVLTALTCLFLAAFLFEEAVTKAKFFVPSRVLVGFGAVCFTLFSIVSILESGVNGRKA